jgi:hypothetical protein
LSEKGAALFVPLTWNSFDMVESPKKGIQLARTVNEKVATDSEPPPAVVPLRLTR